MHDKHWKENFNKILDFRKKLKNDYGLPVKLEFHTKNFLTDKNPYRNYNLNNDDKRNIILNFFTLFLLLILK